MFEESNVYIHSIVFFFSPGVDKRQSVSISQLARLLNNLKARNVDEDGVKLQSLRFGKK